MRVYEGLGINMFTDSQLESIHLATMRVLEETGVRVYSEEAREIFAGAGCLIDAENSIVRIPQHIVEDAITSAPSKVLLAARDPRQDVVLQKGNVYFTTFGTGVSVVDPRTGELRDSTLEDLGNIVRVADALDEVARCTEVVAARDVPEGVRELYQVEAILNNTSKHLVSGASSTYNVRKLIEMGVAISGDLDSLRARPVVSASTCPHSPLTLHIDNAEVILEGATAGVPVSVLTMAMAGGTAPVTLAGAMVITNAEVLSGIVLCQLVRRGNPVIYGSSTTMLDLLHSTAPTGCPEFALVCGGVAQLGHYYGIPTNVGGNWADSKLSDAQIGHEKTLTALLPALCGATSIYGMGVVDAGMTFSYAQLLMDCEFVRMAKAALRGIAVNEETLAVDVIKAVGAGKNYLAQAHTLRLMEREQSRARLIDRRMRDSWLRKGGKDLAERANEEALNLLDSHRPMPLEPSAQKAIRSIVSDAEQALA